jgi:hypothetical protein
MDASLAVLIGVASSLAASAVFLAGMRLILIPKLGISQQIALQQNEKGERVCRIKVVNQRRFSEVVNVNFELVTLRPIAGDRGKNQKLDPYVYRLTRLELRPQSVVALPRCRGSDHRAEYALRVTTPQSTELTTALEHENSQVRFRAYGEHAWSRRGKTFEMLYSTAQSARSGDFYLGRSLDMC